MFNALTYFAIPKSLLERDVALHLLIKDESEASMSSMPRFVAGMSSLKEKLGLKLQELLFDPSHPSVNVDVGVEKSAEGIVALLADKQMSKITMEMTCHPQLSDNLPDPTSSPFKQSNGGLEKMLTPGQEGLDQSEKWQLLTRELVQKQEIVHRLMRENDDKSQSLKLATAEIVDLRRAMKMLQGESQILKKKLGE